LYTRLSKQQRMILAILRKKGKGWAYFDTVRDELLKAKGLTWETASFRSSLSRTIKHMEQKGFIGLHRDQWSQLIVGQLPIWRFARLTRFGLWVAEWVESENRPKLESN